MSFIVKMYHAAVFCESTLEIVKCKPTPIARSKSERRFHLYLI